MGDSLIDNSGRYQHRCNSVVAGISTSIFYLGIFGLEARPIVWEDHPSLITILKEKKLIPGLLYGYTAGVWYSKRVISHAV